MTNNHRRLFWCRKIYFSPDAIFGKVQLDAWICFLPFPKRTESLYRSSAICPDAPQEKSWLPIFLKKLNVRTAVNFPYHLTASSLRIFFLWTEVPCPMSFVKCGMRDYWNLKEVPLSCYKHELRTSNAHLLHFLQNIRWHRLISFGFTIRIDISTEKCYN